MKDILIKLLEQLPQALDGTLTQTQVLDTAFQMPEFREGRKVFDKVYIFDELNNLIISHIQSLGYQTSKQAIELPKVPGPDLVLDTKGLFELNKTEDFKWFVQKLFQKLSNTEALKHCTLASQWIFINIKVSDYYLSSHLAQLQENSETFGAINYPKYTGKKLMMEYSAPNMAKSMSIGNFRNTIIGQIIYNILQQTGCEHFNWNYIGDWWTAFGKFLISLQYSYHQDPTIIDQILEHPESMMGIVYGRFKDVDIPEKEEKARKIVQLLESDNEVIIQLRTQVRKLSMMDFDTAYKVLNINFDCTLWESFSVKLDNDVLSDLKEKDIVHESQGALIIKMKRTTEGKWKPLTSAELDTWEEGKDQVLVFAKSDGSSLYAPRDLALVKRRAKTLGAEKLVYVVWSEQSVYFEHIISLSIALGYIQDNQMMHLGYGLYLQNGKKMAARTGWAYRVIDLIDEITQAILAQFEDRLDYETAQKLAVSALIINDTKGDIAKDVNLDIASMTKLNGDTWIYVQYTAVRLRKLYHNELFEGTAAKKDSERTSIDWNYLSPEQKHILFLWSLLPQKTKTALEMHKPHVLTQYLLEMTWLLNKRYNDSPKALDMDIRQRNTVIIWLKSCIDILEKTMNLLHMPRIEKM